jgi:hypothetical protein
MSLLTVCQSLAKNVGLAVPIQVVGAPQREWEEALEYANEAGRELARRVDWSALASEATLTGTGADVAHALPADFGRLQRGVTVRYGGAIVRPLTRQEWNTLTAVEGSPRYFLLEDDTLRLWPYLANADTATVNYQSSGWVNASDAYSADDQTADLDEDLLTMGLIVRWRRQKGMPYDDFEAEYEAALRDKAGFDRRARF